MKRHGSGQADDVENEVKLRVASLAEARESLRRSGAVQVRARELEDNVQFDDAPGSLLAGGRLLRLRHAGGAWRLTFKGPPRIVEGVRSREELEVGLDDGETLHAVLERLGFRPRFRYQKYRETYRWEDVEIVVDETPIGNFLEIEGAPAEIRRAAAALGYGPEDYITASYTALFFAAGGQGDMVFS